MNSLWQFWMLAVLCATSQGGIQALSRSMFGKLIPDKPAAANSSASLTSSASSRPSWARRSSALSVPYRQQMLRPGSDAATATAEQVDAINAAAGPFGILSVILIIIVGAVLYFACCRKL